MFTTTSGTPDFDTNGFAPCADEDGPAPCYWDAAHMGNGIGQSYFLLPSDDPAVEYTVEYVTTEIAQPVSGNLAETGPIETGFLLAAGVLFVTVGFLIRKFL